MILDSPPPKSSIATIRKWGILHAILSTALSSIAIIFQASATKEINPLLLAALSNLIGGSVIGLMLVSSGKFPSIQDIGQNFRNLFYLAFLRSFMGAILFWVGLSLTLGVKAMFFTKAEPYFIIAWDWLLDRRRVSKKHLALLFVHICGAVLLSTGSFEHLDQTQSGDLILVIAVAVLGLSYRFGARLSTSLGVFQTISTSQIMGGLFLLPIGLFFSPSNFNIEAGQAWGYFLFSILLWNVLGISFWLLALKEVDTWIVSSLRAIGPLIAAPIAYFCFDERLTPLQILGGGIVILTSFLIVQEQPKK